MEYEEYLADNPDSSSSEKDSKIIELTRSSDFGGNQSSDEHEKNPDSPPEGRQTGNEYEDGYFTHLSNAESEDDMEHSSVDFRKTEEILGQIAQQKNSPESMHIDDVENPQITIVERVKSTEMPPPAEPPLKLIIKHSDSNKSNSQNENLYP
ncbi:hypothetical protein JTB14_014000 [Gonioctena quinquepunctata]|nr:hypothetical protein JTB14_014000 [Gonioctena quinquepunctata]